MGEESSHPLKNVVVAFDLPFVMRVVDSIREETTPAGYEQYFALVNGIPLMLRFEKKLRDLGGVQIATEDRLGLLNYSTAQVWFDKQAFDKLKIEENFRMQSEVLIAYALEGINRFVELYRHVTGSFWIRRVRRAELANVTIVGRKWDGHDDPFITGTLGTGLGLGSFIEAEQDGILREGLLTEWRPSEFERFSYLVDSLMEREEYWSAVLAAEILFEAKVARLLHDAFRSIGITESEIDGKFERDGYPRPITNLLTNYVEELTGMDIEDTKTKIGKTFEGWKAKGRDLRNDIAHGKLLSVSSGDAREAVSSVKRLLDELDRAFRVPN